MVGGGPGVGPICVAKHLAPFLPSHPLSQKGDQSVTISWRSLGLSFDLPHLLFLHSNARRKGFEKSNEIAILNANYVKTRIGKHYEILYKGESGRAAHEFIIDCRPFKKKVLKSWTLQND